MTHAQAIFDTLKYVNHLEDHGFSERQAKGLADAQIMVAEAQEANVATKHDLDMTRIQLDNKIDSVKFELESKIDKSAHKVTVNLFTGMTGMMAVFVGIVAILFNYMS